MRRDRLSLDAKTDEQGAFRLRGLPPGEWTLELRVDREVVKRTVATGVPVEIDVSE